MIENIKTVISLFREAIDKQIRKMVENQYPNVEKVLDAEGILRIGQEDERYHENTINR